MGRCALKAHEPFTGTVEHEFENDLMPLFKKTLRLGGFALDKDSGIWNASTCSESIVQVFGPNASRGHFNGLVQFQGFKARMVHTSSSRTARCGTRRRVLAVSCTAQPLLSSATARSAPTRS